MATYTKLKVKSTPHYNSVPSGNAAVLAYHFETTSAGKWTDSDVPGTAIADPTTLILGVIPAGTHIQDSLAIVSDAFTASTVLKLGFAYVDGVDVTAVPQDDDYFHAALAINAAGRTRQNNLAVVPVTLPKDAYLVGVSSGAAHASAGVLDFLIYGIVNGNP